MRQRERKTLPGQRLADKRMIFQMMQMPVQESVSNNEGNQAGKEVSVAIKSITQFQGQEGETKIGEKKDAGDDCNFLSNVEIEQEDHDRQQEHLQEDGDQGFFENHGSENRDTKEDGDLF